MKPTPPAHDTPPSEPAIATTLDVLRWLASNPDAAATMDALGQSVARAYKRVRKQRRIDASHRPAAPEAAGIDPPPPPGAARSACYVCTAPFDARPRAYPLLCPACAQVNVRHRDRRASLAGRTAVVTGGRVNIGAEVVLKLLRDGCRVIATTRFPASAAARYAAEPDFEAWSARLSLHALDLCDLRAVVAFTDHLTHAHPHGIDILINNAAQTLSRPPAYYQPLLAAESAARRQALPAAAASVLAAAPVEPAPPPGALDAAPHAHSWMLTLPDVPAAEMAQVMVINAMSPFVLLSRLEPLLRKSTFPDRYVVNVTSAEGQFTRATKPSQHPHTNMAKAALNMLTRTAAPRCARDGIYINSVDPGWVTHMTGVDPATPDPPRSDFTPPLDAVDAAARVYDPILRGIAGDPVFGLLLRNYAVAPW